MRVVVVQFHLLGGPYFCVQVFILISIFIEFIDYKTAARLRTKFCSSISFSSCTKFGTSIIKVFFLMIYHGKFSYLADIYLFKVNNGNTRTMYKICSKVTIKKPERQINLVTSISINFEQISHIALVFPLLTLNTLETVTFNCSNCQKRHCKEW